VTDSFRAWKHVALLAALVGTSLLEPLAVNLSQGVSIGLAAITLLVFVVVLLAVFETQRERRTSMGRSAVICSPAQPGAIFMGWST
jgi:hypothetical protein